MSESLTDPARERTARQSRHWVRLTRACNNRCGFCLDADAQDGSMLPRDELERQLEAGRERGAERLILSGGEATIHPDFVTLVRHGKRCGYRHVQTITNGRMFAYRGFAEQALAAGLDEVTFSLHGHTAALHDRLVGVPGAFAQTVAGIRRVVGRCVVSGDVVIHRHNVDVLPRVLELFLGLGVREFDLLMVVPFGRAAPGESDALFDPAAHLAPLREALAFADRPGVHLWTNRLDPRLLEGREGLIQDPHKLHDEIRGRADLLAERVAGGPMRCAGDRCSACFLRPLCRALGDAVTALRDGVPGVLRVDVRADDVDRHAALLARPRRALWVRAEDADQAAACPGAATAGVLWLELDRLDGLDGHPVLAGRRRWRLVLRDGVPLAAAEAASPDELWVPVEADTVPALATPPRPGVRRVLGLRTPATLSETARRHVELGPALRGVRADVYDGIPPCLSGGADVRYDDPLPLAVVDAHGRVDPERFVDHYVRRLYRVRSLRCDRCAARARCRGLPIQRVRHAGLGVLRPIPPRGG